MNTANFILGGNIARASFRWTFDQPEKLSARSRETYKQRLETFEFDCAEHRYRSYNYVMLDESGRVVRRALPDTPGPWRDVFSSNMMERLFVPACALFKQKTDPRSEKAETAELLELAHYVFSLSRELEKSKDFKIIIRKYFAPDYLKYYLDDKKTNWFVLLDRETAAKANHEELQRFYIALLNISYLSSVYLLSQHHYIVERSLPELALIPAEVLQIIDAHSYTGRYRRGRAGYDYLEEQIDSVERLRTYTDLLENISLTFRRRISNLASKDFVEYRKALGRSEWDDFLINTDNCSTNCLGLPQGTNVFEVVVDVFRLRIAKVNGTLKVISATFNIH